MLFRHHYKTTKSNFDSSLIIGDSLNPFGSVISDRTWSDQSRNYRFGFNGKEKDFETASDNYDFGARIYDGRLGRWLSSDPLFCISPWNGSNVSFSNDPINRIDPNGMADFYTKDGKHLGSDGKNDDIAYVTTEEIMNNNTNSSGNTNWNNVINNNGTSKCSIKNSELLSSAATIYAETSGDKTESYAIASTTKNASIKGGVTFYQQITKPNYSYGYKSDKYWLFMRTKASNRSMDMIDCIGAVLNTISGGKDYSNGATQWDGRDVFVKGRAHFRYRKAHSSTDSRIGIFVPMEFMESVKSLQLELMDIISNKFIESMQREARGTGKRDWGYFKTYIMLIDNQMSLLTNQSLKGSLWKVTAVHGQSVFYSQVPKDENSSEQTKPQAAYELSEADKQTTSKNSFIEWLRTIAEKLW